MIVPEIDRLSKNGKYNRYELVIATSKTAHLVTDEYCRQRDIAEKKVTSKETDKPIVAMITPALSDEKAVRNAIKLLYDEKYEIVDESIEN